MNSRERELFDIGKHAKARIEQCLQDAGQLCDSDYERWQLVMALQVHFLGRMALEYAAFSPIMREWPPEVRLFCAATFACQMSTPAGKKPSTVTPETLERAWKAILKAAGNLEGAPQHAAHG